MPCVAEVSADSQHSAGAAGAAKPAAASAAQSAPADQTSSAVNPLDEVAEPEGPSGVQEVGDHPRSDAVQSTGYIRLSWWAGCHHEVADSVEALHGRPHIIWAPNAGVPPFSQNSSFSLESLAGTAGKFGHSCDQCLTAYLLV